MGIETEELTLKTPTPRRPSRLAVKRLQSVNRINQLMQEWEKLVSFERRVKRYQMGLPRSLYKYRSIPPESDTTAREQFEDLILSNNLWLATCESFNDPFEGQAAFEVPHAGVELRQALERKRREMGFTSAGAKAAVTSEEVAHPERLIARIRRAVQTSLSQTGICSLSAKPSNPLLWAHYADSHKGLCIQLNPHLDIKSLLAFPVQYPDDYPVYSDILDLDKDGGFLPMLRKSKDWSYENEWRLVRPGSANTKLHFVPEAMGAVILGMRISDNDLTYVMGLMDQRQRLYGVRPVIYRAERDSRRYRIIVRKYR